jgi:hypothetical protein
LLMLVSTRVDFVMRASRCLSFAPIGDILVLQGAQSGNE